MLFSVEFEFEIAATVSRSLNLDNFDKEEAFLSEDHVFVGFIDILRLHDFYDVTYLSFQVLDFFTHRFFILPFLFLNMLFKIKISSE